MWQNLTQSIGDYFVLPPEIARVMGALLVSAFCGLIFGLERELRGKPAGIRTFILICCGSTLFTLASLWSVEFSVGQAGDASRVVSQIVTGIGFLGAGSIIQSRGAVTGMTTAATIWATAAIGILVGLGRPFAAIGATSLLLLMMTVFDRVEVWLRSHYGRWYRLKIYYEKPRKKALGELREVMNAFDVIEYRFENFFSDGKPVSTLPADKDKDFRIEVILSYPFGGFQLFIKRMTNLTGVQKVEFEPIIDDIELPEQKTSPYGKSGPSQEDSPRTKRVGP